MTASFTPFQLFKMGYSTILLVFSIVTITIVIFNGDTKVAAKVHPAVAFAILWVAVIWLSMVEGGQGALVGLPPVNTDLYKDSHPLTLKCTEITNKGDNLDRYLMGRQFMVVCIVFAINNCGGPLKDANDLNLPSWMQVLFLEYGLAMILLTACVGQLTSQVNASHCMLDYINNYFALFTLYTAMAIEFSGLLHTSYLVQMYFIKISGKDIERREEPRNFNQNVFFWARVLLSLYCLGFSLAVTLQALFDGKTTVWDGAPKVVSVILFFVLMCIIGMLEGMQIAFFAVTKLPKEEQGKHPMALKTCKLLFMGEGRNLPGFMIGRQLCVVSCFFFVARITSLDVDAGDETVFGVSAGMQEFFNTGLLGAYVTTIIGSITWQLVASSFPSGFLSNPLVYVLLNICLFLEATGICSASWFLAVIQKQICGFQNDEVYIGTAEERAAKDLEDHEGQVEAGHLFPGTNGLILKSNDENESEVVKCKDARYGSIQSIINYRT